MSQGLMEVSPLGRASRLARHFLAICAKAQKRGEKYHNVYFQQLHLHSKHHPTFMVALLDLHHNVAALRVPH